ncbi:MAG: helix-turn-helix domain-containing protein [Prolixibacteraceae bacterium]|jgi:transcriptional regulator with XRE-family HTH domain|nr:helix-turn-helix domain-containing protein [Prolixibacteraceae bacterium]MDI9564141.1 helix-turn-helix domain-containing protein [Bacteroidota bacterium]NLS99104.1 helix-turn-helix domain-containing protein [Bacteroidales bacterium]OQB79588.1 MAG: antitoxin HipB [Bacteroidetes bacterium ADurb.Bin123]HNU78251.1 helix-turn-helix domain-containing protein [Prolixibacteraceae bacterium]
MLFAQNIKFLRKRKDRTQDEVAEALGMKRSTLSGYENEVAMPAIPALIQFSDYYGIAVDTLVKVDLTALNGHQLYMLEHGEDVFLRGGKLRVLATTVDRQNRDNIELVPEKAKAGYTRGFFDPEYINELPRYQLPFLPPDRKYRTFQISGDSMLPIPEGAWVTGEFVQDWLSLPDGEACIVLTLDEGIVFKIVENKIRGDGTLRLISLNPVYEPYSVNVAEVREIWRFVNYTSNEIPTGNLSGEMIGRALYDIRSDLRDIKGKLL